MTNEPLNQPVEGPADSNAGLTPLERSLGALTIGPDAETSLWKTALERVAPAELTATQRFWSRRLPTSWSVAAAIVLVVGTLVLLASVGGVPRAKAPRDVAVGGGSLLKMSANDGSFGTLSGYKNSDGVPSELLGLQGRGADGDLKKSSARASGDERSSRFYERLSDRSELGNTPPGTVAPPSSVSSISNADRHVIRKSTLDLATADVRATFAKSALVINEALGEYIETSSLTGEGQGAQGSITLRIAASRLGSVLNELRPLGTVVAENSTGQDVTESVVDLEARIRNEERIERELLALIDKRPDAPLKDVLEIRAQLSSVRAQIEGMMGQRQRIGRLVSLATVLVTIRAKDAPVVVEKERGIGDYFVSSIESSWNSALRALADTAAGLIRVFVGGIFWWALAGAGAVLIWRAANRAAAKRAAEPAPTA